MSSSKLKALFLLPVLLILFSFGEGDKSIPKFPLAENSLEENEFDLSFIDDGNFLVSTKENTFYIDGEVVDPTVEERCETVSADFAAPSAIDLYMTGGMKRNMTLFINYTYVPNLAPEGVTTFQWFMYDDRFGFNKTAIPGATTQLFQVRGSFYGIGAGALVGKYISVEVTPVDNTLTAGIAVEFRPWNGGNNNPVLDNTTNCIAPSNPGILLTAAVNQCSPRNITNFKVNYTGINYRNDNSPVIFIDWGDGPEERFDATMVNAVPPVDFVGITERANLVNIRGQQWEVNETHIYDYDDAGNNIPADLSCTYSPTTYFGVKLNSNNSTVLTCRSLDQSTKVFVWDDIGNTDLGTHDVDHDASSAGVEPVAPVETVDVCRGDDNPVRLIDVSTFNCTPVIEPVNDNDQSRWIQWVYGSTNNVTTGAAANEKIIINGVSYDDTDLPIYGTPIQAPAAVSSPPAATFITDDIQMPVSSGDGQIFEVTLRSWNTCNPFSLNDDLSPPQGNPNDVFDIYGVTNQGGGVSPYFANADPITRTYDIRIAPKPPIPTAGNKDYCYGTVLAGELGFQFSTASGIVATEWYEDNAGIVDFGNQIANSNGATATELDAGDYTGAGVGGTGFTGTDDGTYFVWGRYSSVSGVNTCWSDPVRIQFDVREQLFTPASVSSTEGGDGFTVCADNGNITFTVDDGAPGTGTPGGAWQYDWAFGSGALNDNLNWVSGDGGQNRTLDITSNAASGARRVRVRRRYAANDDKGTRCATSFKTFDFTIDPVSIGGALTQTNTNICLGDQTGNITVTGATGSVIAWEVNINGGGFNLDGGLVGNPINPTPAVAGSHQYRATVKSGVCSTTFSGTVTVNVNPIPPKPTISEIGSGLVICQDGASTTSLQSTDVGGLAAIYEWYEAGNLVVPVQANASNQLDLTTVAESGTYHVKVVGVAPTGCESLLSDGVLVRIEPLPTAANPIGGGSVCSGNAAPDIVWTLTGRPPFNITYTIDKNNVLFTTENVLNYTPAEAFPGPYTFTITNPDPLNDFDGTATAPDFYDYQLTVLTDDVVATDPSCAATAFGNFATVIIGGVAPSFVTGPTLSPNIVCDAGGTTTDPTLLFRLDAANINGLGFVLTYKIDASADRTKNFNTDGVGDPTAAITFSDAELNTLVPSPHVVTIVSILSPSLCLSTFNTDIDFTVRPLPNITLQPTNEAICEGNNVSFLVTSAGAAVLSYQWQEDPDGAGALPFVDIVNGGVYSGATTATLTLTAAPAVMDGNLYKAIITGYNLPTVAPTCPIESSVATLTVNTFPVVTVNPADQEECETSTATFTITAAGPGIVYRWQQDPDGAGPLPFADLADGLSGGVTYAGTGSATLTMTTLTNALNGSDYRVKLTTTGSCESFSNAADLIVNPLPDANNITPSLCEDQPRNSDKVVGHDLTIAAYTDAITGIIGSAGRTITYFTLPTRLPVNQILVPINVEINDGEVIYVRVTDTATGTTNCTDDATMLFTVFKLPEGVDQNAANNALETEFCEEAVASADKDNINLTTLNDNVIGGGIPADRTVVWYLDPGGVVSGPSDLVAIVPGGGLDVDNVTDGTLFYALITDTSNANNCKNFAQVEITVLPRPLDNPIQAPDLTTPATLTICKSAANQLFQINPALNVGSTYSWSVPSGPGQFVVVGPTNLQFVVIVADNVIGGVGLPITLTETLANGCVGNVNTMNIIVTGAPAQPVIGGPDDVCDGDNGVVYSITLPIVGNSYAWDINGLGTIVLGQGSSSITVNIGNSSDVITVVESSPAGCTSPAAAPKNVTVNPLPNMTSSNAETICDNVLVSSVLSFTDDIGGGTTYAWKVVAKTGTIGGTLVNDIGPGDISQTLTNTSGAIGTVTYEVVPTTPAPAGCAGPTQLVTITVNSAPVGVNDTETICSDVALNYNIQIDNINTIGNSLASDFSWVAADNINVTGETLAPSALGLITDDLINTTNSDQIVVYTISPTGQAGVGGCSGVDFTYSVTVRPEPVGANVTEAAICSDLAIGYNLSTIGGSVAAGSYNISVNANGLTQSAGTVSGGNGKLATEIADDTWTNTGLIPVDVIYTVTPVSAASCDGQSFTVTVPIDPEPVGSNSTEVAICSDVAIGYNISTSGVSVAASTYNISVNANGLVQSAGTISAGLAKPFTEIADDAWTNTGLNAVNVVYTLSPISAASCQGNDFTITVPINPEPVGSNVTEAAVCSDLAIGYNISTTGTSVAAASFTIAVNPNGLVQSGGTASSGAGKAATEIADDIWTNTGLLNVNVEYTITPVSGAGCQGNSFVITVPIRPEPVGSNVTEFAICSDLPIGYNISTLGTSVAASSFNISVNANGLALSAGTDSNGNGKLFTELADDAWTNTGLVPVSIEYTIFPISAAGCIGNSFIVTVPINPEPVGADVIEAAICSDIAIGYNIFTLGTSVAATLFNISTNANGLSQSAGTVSAGLGKVAAELADDAWTNTGLNTVNVVYTITPISGAGCEGNSFTITVPINPEPVGANSTEAAICSDVAIGYNILTSGAAVAAASFNIAVNPNGLIQSAGTNSAGNGKAATELADDTWTNTGLLPVNVVYSIIPVSGANCLGNSFTITVPINPEPVGANSVEAAICSDIAIGYNLSSLGTSVAATTYNISVNSNGLTQSGGTDSNGNGKLFTEIADDIWNNTGLLPVNVVYSVVPVSSLNCKGNTFTVTVPIDPEPVGVDVTEAAVCSDIPLGYNISTLGTSVAAASFNIAINANGLLQSAGTVSSGAGKLTTELADDAWTNIGLNAVNVVYTITPVSGGANCLGNSFTITVPINPEPVGSNVIESAVCSDVVIGYNISTSGISVAAATFNIAVNANGLVQSAGTNSAGNGKFSAEISDDAWTNTGLLTVNIVYSVIPVSGAGCIGNSFDIIVPIDPEPVGSSIVEIAVCSDIANGYTISTSGTSVAATSYNISVNANGLVQSAGTISGGNGKLAAEISDDAWTNTGLSPVNVVYTITPFSADNCQGSDFTIAVPINPEPVGSDVIEAAICSDLAIGYNISTSGTSVASGTFIIAVNPNGLVQSAGTNSVGAGKLSTEISDDAWTNTGLGPVNVVYTLIPVSGANCQGNSFTITVPINPEPVGVDVVKAAACSDIANGYTITTQGTSVAATTFNIAVNNNGLVQSAGTPSNGNGKLAAEISDDAWTNTGLNPVNIVYTITPVSGASCLGNPFDITVPIDPEPVGASSIEAAICSDVAIGYNISTSGASVVASAFNISVNANGLLQSAGTDSNGNGKLSTELADDEWTNTSVAPVNIIYTIIPISAVGCAGNSFTITVPINPESQGFSDNISTCSNAALNYDLQANVNDIGSGGNGLASNFVWVAAPNGNVTGESTANQNTAFITDNLVNITNLAETVIYTVTPTGQAGVGSCEGNSFTVSVTVNPETVGLNDSNVAYNRCSGDALSYDIQAINISGLGNNVLSTFTYTVTSTDPGYVAGANDRAIKSTSPITDTYTNTTGIDVTIQYTITPFDFVTSCQGADFTVDFVIYSEPVGSNDAVIGCSDVALNYDIQTLNIDLGNGVASDFTYTVSSDNVLVNAEPNRTGKSALPITYTYTNTSAVDANITYTITPISQANNCQGVSFDVVFTIQVEPAGADFSNTLCGGVVLNHDLNTDIVNGIVSNFTYTVSSNNAGVIAAPNRVVASAVNITDAYNNATATDAVITYVVTPIDQSTSCPGDAFNVVFTIQPGPEGVPDMEAECSGVALNYDIQSDNVSNGGNNVAGKYRFTVLSSNAGVVAPEADRVVASTLPITFIYTNTSSNFVDITYTITPEGFGAGCTGSDFDVVFRINPEPVINPQSQTICSDDNLTINPTLANFAVGDVNFTWEITNISGTVSGVAVNDTDVTNVFPHSITNTSSAPAIITYSFVATSTILNNCVGEIEDILVTVNPKPVGTPTTVTTVCSNDPFSVNPDAFISNLAGNSFTWTANYGALTNGTGAGVGVINETLTNTTNATIEAEYTITPSSSAAPSCSGSSFIIKVPIKPEPVFDSSLTPADVCSGIPSNITLIVLGTSVPADAYDINQITLEAGLVAGGSNASIGPNQPANVLISDIFTNTTNVQKLVTYKVRPVTAGCKGDEVDVIFKVNPAPAMDDNLSKVVCSNGVSGIILSQKAGSAPVLDYNLVAVTKDPGLTTVVISLTSTNVGSNYIANDQFVNSTNDPLTVVYELIPNSTALPSCAGPNEFITLTVEPGIIAAPINNNTTICSNDLTNIELVSPSNPTAGAVSFNVTVVVTSGAASGYVPALNFLPEGYTITDNLVNTGNVDAIVEYTITPTASAAASNVGCTGTASVVSVIVEPLPQVTPGQNIQVCSNIALNHTITTSNNLVGTKFKWTLADINIPAGVTGATERLTASTDPISDVLINTNAFRSTVTYTVTPVGPSANNCEGAPISIIVFVDPTPVGAIAIDQPVVCSGGSALLSFAMTVGVAPFTIVYNDGSGDITVSNIANSHFIALTNLTNTTTYTFKSIMDVNGCVLTPVGDQVTVTVETPISEFSIISDTGCTPLVVTFSNDGLVAGDGTEYTWSFGDGTANIITSDATVTHTYVNNSTLSDISFSPLLIAKRTNGTVVCTQLSSGFVTINAGVSLNVAQSETEGCSPVTVNFDNLSQGVLESKWFWRIKGQGGENEVQTSFFASYTLSNNTANNIVYEVVYQGDRNGCGDEVVSEVTVYPEVVADFDVLPSTTISISDPTITVTNTTPLKDEWTTLWEWGDGQSTTSVDPGSHTYASFGTYELKLTVKDPNGICEDEKIVPIIVEPTIPEVDFSAIGQDIETGDFTDTDLRGCMPYTVQFTDLSESVDPNTYVWTFIDETGATVGTSTAQNPEFTFFQPGIINVTLEGGNPLGVKDIETKLGYIEIFELPTSAFSVRPSVVFLPDQALSTSNLSRLSDEFQWDFDGDGILDSDEFQPQFKYSDPGVYDVMLIALNSETGCSDTTILEGAVTVVESGSSDIPNGFFPGSGFGDGGDGTGGASESNVVFLPRIKGVRDDGFIMQVFDRWGHLLFESNDKTVGWNGRNFNTGKLMAAGVYVYKLELVYISGEQTTIVGDINLIR